MAGDYDVTINTSIYTPHRADALVLMAYLAKFGGLPLSGRRAKESRGAGKFQLEEPPATD